MYLAGGDRTLTATGDGVSAATDVIVAGGTLTAATGDDALHADTALTVSAGTVTVTRSYEGIEAMQTTLAGGTVTVTATDDAVNAAEEGVDEMRPAPNAFIRIATTAGVQLASFPSTRVLKGVIFDLSGITRGTQYRIYTGGSVSGTAVGGGLYTGGTLSGTLTATVTAGSGRA